METSLAVTNVIFYWDLALRICLADGSVIITGDPHFMQISLLRFFKTFLIFGLCIFGTNFISLLQFFDYFWPKNRSNEIKLAKNRISQIFCLMQFLAYAKFPQNKVT